MNYNSSREKLEIREYGRYIQKMVDYVLTIQDPEKRNKNANAIIDTMSFFNKEKKVLEDYTQTLWDHLHVISNFKLEVDSPFEKPTPEKIYERPEPLKYPKRNPKFNHLGKNIELIINKGIDEKDEDKKEGLANTAAYYMKLAYSNWHKELIHDEAIQAELTHISNGQLEFTNKLFVKHRTDSHMDRDDYIGIKPKKKAFTNNNRNGFQQNNNRNNNPNSQSNNNPNSQNNNNPNSQNNNRNSNPNQRPNKNFKKRY